MAPSKNPRRKEWFDDDRFWIDLYPYMFPPSKFSQAQIIVEKILKLAKPRSKSALDLCCGPGRCSVQLAGRGYAVTGVDRTPFMLEKARLSARRAKARIEWVRSDMRDFVRPGSFGLVINLFTSFGYFNDKNEDVTVLKNIHASLKKNGVLVMEMKSKEWVCRHISATTSEQHPDGTLFVERHRLFENCTKIHNDWILIRNKRTKTFTFSHTVYSAQELIDRLGMAGFSDVKIYGDFDGGEFTHNSPRLIAVAKKNV